MTERHKLGVLSQIPKGEGRNFQVGAVSVAVFHTRDGRVFATQASCPHRQGPLADGLLGGSTLVCPLHEWHFDLETGRVLTGGCDIRVYAISVETDELWLELPSAPRAPVARDN
jgi:nitrite reductase (NADH) small subunit